MILFPAFINTYFDIIKDTRTRAISAGVAATQLNALIARHKFTETDHTLLRQHHDALSGDDSEGSRIALKELARLAADTFNGNKGAPSK